MTRSEMGLNGVFKAANDVSPEYNDIHVENGRIAAIQIGDYRSGCSCRLDSRPEGCDIGRAMRCIGDLLGKLSSEDLDILHQANVYVLLRS